MNNFFNEKEESNILESILNKILYLLNNFPFLYRTSGSETDINSNSLVSTGAITISSGATDFENLVNIDSYSQQQTAKQASILQWYNTVRKKVT